MGKRILIDAKNVLDEILDIIYEPDDTCPICSQPFMQKEYLCPNCINEIKYCIEACFPIEDKKYFVHSLSYFSGITQRLIINLKYRNDLNAGRFLARLLYLKFKDLFNEIDFLIPAPCTEKSFQNRGYNQAYVICKEIEKISGIKTLDILKKSNTSKDQIGLSKEKRWLNLEKAIEIKSKKTKLSSKIAMLIDDVFTTGATSYHCAETLVKEGIERVIILTVAKGSI